MKKQTENKYFGSPWTEIEDATRYNGGWTKSVVGIDRSKNNGYSLQGEFMGKDGDTYEVSKLYLDCGIAGSRKNQEKYYNLFTVGPDGSITVIVSAKDTRGWALELWDDIEGFLNANTEPFNPLAQYSDAELIAEMKRRGIQQVVS